MALPPDVQNAIDDIRAVIDSGRPLIMGKVFIDEQAFYIGTSRLKKSLPESWGQMATVRRSNAENFNSLVQIDELEMIAERGKFHVFGKVLVDEQACLQKLESVQAALIKDIAEAQAWSAAQTEAERIIAEAKIEAERIKEEARRQSESPWNG
jgi:hypothetical protein